MNIAINISALNPRDQQTAAWMVKQENERRSALTPPVSPLPSATGGEIESSYEAVLVRIVTSAHASYIQQEAEANGPNQQSFKDAFSTATPAQRAAALAALMQ